MIAPKRFDFICEVLPYFIAAMMALVGGPSIIAGAFQAQGVPPDVAQHFATLLPWWVPIVAAVLAGAGGVFLRMCYPGVQFPTSANTAALEQAVKDWLASHPMGTTTTTMKTPELPGHPSTEIKVETNASGTPSITAP